MSFTSLDRFLDAHPWLFDFFRLRIVAFFGTSPAENVCFPLFAAFACGIMNCSSAFGWISSAIFVLMLLSWVLSSLLSGFLKRWYFIVFSAAFNLLPYVFINAAEKEIDDVNEILAFISRFTSVYANAPLVNMGIDSFVVSATIAGGSALFMLLGFLIRGSLKNSRAYCRIRLSMLDSDKK